MIENKNRNAEESKSIRVAEESRETDWKAKSFMASLFMGELATEMCAPYPEQDPADRAIGDEVCARVRAWCDENLDGDAIDAAGEIPAHVFKGLNDMGLWGIKIPKEYGGLGLSQINYMRILGLISCYCGSTAATLSAHQSIGLSQPLKLFGTRAQKQQFLPRVARGEISAFALTEPGVGSDPANMLTHAEPTEDGSAWILNGEKLWCTNGVIADLLVVMARTPSITRDGREVRQITAFIVEKDWEGIEVMHRSSFMGLRGIENAVLRFTDVRIPSENIIGGVGRGLKIALATLNDGRLGIPAVTAFVTEELAQQSTRWAVTRSQWGKNIGEHEAGADKLARLSAGAYAMETLSLFGAAMSDRGGADIRIEAAAAKMFCSELGWELADTALQLRGGRGYETPDSLRRRGEHAMPMERALRDTRINRIVEGTTDIMHLFLAREALDAHLRLAGPLLGRGSVGEKLRTLVKCAAFYPVWYTKLWVGGLFRSFSGFEGGLRSSMRYVESRTRKLARALFHNMILQGPKLEMRQLTLNRLVDIGAELGVMALVASRAQGELSRGDRRNLKKAAYWLESRRIVVDDLFARLSDNADAAARALAKEMMEGAEPLPQLAAPDLTPMEQERGRDLTSGRQTTRRVARGSEAAK